jgi:hypothetical protein
MVFEAVKNASPNFVTDDPITSKVRKAGTPNIQQAWSISSGLFVS